MKKIFEKIGKLAWIKFIRRYWVLLGALSLFLGLALNNALFDLLGSAIYVPSLTLAAMASALFLRNVFNSSTSDLDADSGLFEDEWKKLDGKTRVTLAVYQLLAYFIGASLIAAALLR